MNKTKQIRKLTRKYFWQEKRKEIFKHFERYGGAYCILMVSFGMVFQAGWIVPIDSTQPICKPLAIVGLCFLGFWAFFGLVALIVVIWEWIESNWEKARLKAIQDVKKMKKGSGK